MRRATNNLILILILLFSSNYAQGQCGHLISIGKTPMNVIEYNVWPGSLDCYKDDSTSIYFATNSTDKLEVYYTFMDSIKELPIVVLKKTFHDQSLIYLNINQNLGDILKNRILLTLNTQEIRLGSYSNSVKKSRLDSNLLSRGFIWIYLIDTMMNGYKIINGLKVKACTQLVIGFSIVQNLKDSQYYVDNIDKRFVARYNKTWISTGAVYNFKYDRRNNFMREKSKCYIYLDYFNKFGEYAVFNAQRELRFIRLNSDKETPVYDKSVHPILNKF